ncbi:MAG: hypothetical protein PVH61_24320 [Candidatus Aminicenantes bacterium]|jgi:hypothetical protein
MSKGSFTESNKHEWENDFIEEMLFISVKQWGIPLSIPNFELNFVDSGTAGIQLCDFLLWAHQRKILKKDDPWFERTTLKKRSHCKINGGFLCSYTYFLNSEPDDKLNVNLQNKPSRKEIIEINGLFKDNVKINQGIFWIEKRLKNLEDNPDVIKNSLLKKRYVELLKKLNQKNIGLETISEMAKIYLLIENYIPFVDLDKEKNIICRYFLRKICSDVLNDSEAVWVTRRRYWHEVRNSICQKNPEMVLGK